MVFGSLEPCRHRSDLASQGSEVAADLDKRVAGLTIHTLPTCRGHVTRAHPALQGGDPCPLGQGRVTGRDRCRTNPTDAHRENGNNHEGDPTGERES